MLLGQIDAQPTLPVRDLKAARRFYEEVLELEPVGPADPNGVQGYRAGRTVVLVYQSSFAGTNQATAVTWSLGDRFDQVVRELKAKGVSFEAYDIPGTREEDGVHVAENGMKIAWFKDPDGNIINIGGYPA
jgi:catechol 2,3-dioxygenase-like lactoylglutathione lyase family enzyme